MGSPWVDDDGRIRDMENLVSGFHRTKWAANFNRCFFIKKLSMDFIDITKRVDGMRVMQGWRAWRGQNQDDS